MPLSHRPIYRGKALSSRRYIPPFPMASCQAVAPASSSLPSSSRSPILEAPAACVGLSQPWPRHRHPALSSEFQRLHRARPEPLKDHSPAVALKLRPHPFASKDYHPCRSPGAYSYSAALASRSAPVFRMKLKALSPSPPNPDHPSLPRAMAPFPMSRFPFRRSI